jgi:cytochrome c1
MFANPEILPYSEVCMNRWMMAALSAVAILAWGGVSWAAKAPDGKPVFLKYKCNSCHSIEAAGVVKKALADAGEAAPKVKPPDLSSVGLDKKADWIALFMQKKEKLDGELHPKKFRGTDSELKTLTTWLETMKAEKKAELKGKTEDKVEEKSGGEKTGK